MGRDDSHGQSSCYFEYGKKEAYQVKSQSQYLSFVSVSFRGYRNAMCPQGETKGFTIVFQV